MNTDRTTLAVILVLGAAGLMVIGGGIYLVANDKSIPDALIAIGSAAIASVGTLLARPGPQSNVDGGNEGYPPRGE